MSENADPSITDGDTAAAPVTAENDPMADEWAAALAAAEGQDTAASERWPRPPSTGEHPGLRQLRAHTGATGAGNDINMILDIPVQLTVELGRTRIPDQEHPATGARLRRRARRPRWRTDGRAGQRLPDCPRRGGGGERQVRHSPDRHRDTVRAHAPAQPRCLTSELLHRNVTHRASPCCGSSPSSALIPMSAVARSSAGQSGQTGRPAWQHAPARHRRLACRSARSNASSRIETGPQASIANGWYSA